jgi:hypothetical protein
MQQSKINCEIYIFNFGYLSSDNTVYLCEQGCKNPWLSSEAKKVHGAKELAKHCTRHSPNPQDNEDSSPLAGYIKSIYKRKFMLNTKVSQVKTFKKKGSFIADKFDIPLLFFNMVPTVLSACPPALQQHLDYSRRKTDAT